MNSRYSISAAVILLLLGLLGSSSTLAFSFSSVDTKRYKTSLKICLLTHVSVPAPDRVQLSPDEQHYLRAHHVPLRRPRGPGGCCSARLEAGGGDVSGDRVPADLPRDVQHHHLHLHINLSLDCGP